MWYEILVKDLKKRKGINFILFLFILLSTVFIASSVSNVFVVLNGMNRYMEYANVCDVMAVMGTQEGKEDMEEWIKGREEITDSYYEKTYAIKDDDVTLIKSGKEETFDGTGDSQYIGHVDGKYAKPLTPEGRELKLEKGQVGVTPKVAHENDLHPGDRLKITIEDKTYTYDIVFNCRDILYGNDVAGMNRFLFCSEDYERMTRDVKGADIGLYGFNSSDVQKSYRDFNKEQFPGMMTTVNKELYSMMYVFDMIVPALLMIVGFCLILISMLILRFSLVFTMEENYREIGVMKAIGMRNFSIQKIYLIKYVMLVIAGSIVGFGLSIPVAQGMIRSISRNMVLGNVGEVWWLNLLSSIVIVLFVVGMCIVFTGKLKKISAVEAIRNGEKGERYHKRIGLRLYTKKHMGTLSFLGLNDILCDKKRYLVLFIAFCLSFVLITIPLNTTTTMESDKMAEKFNLDSEGEAFLDYLETEKDGEPYHSIPEVQDALKRLEDELEAKGYEVEKMHTGAFYFLNWGEDNWNEKLLSYVPVNTEEIYGGMNEGTAPKLDNEVALSKHIMDTYDLKVGDTIQTKIGGVKKDFIITGSYSDYMQMGKSARLSPKINMEKEIMAGYWRTTVNLKDCEESQEEIVAKLKKDLPGYQWSTAQTVIDASVGDIKQSLHDIQVPMAALLCVMMMLITILMMKLFMMREQARIAMLKSIGYRNRHIMKWLLMRMVWVVLISMIVAIPLSMLSNRFVLTPIFGIMGAELTIQVDPVQAYLIYPGVLLISIALATLFATRGVRKIKTTDMKIAE